MKQIKIWQNSPNLTNVTTITLFSKCSTEKDNQPNSDIVTTALQRRDNLLFRPRFDTTVTLSIGQIKKKWMIVVVTFQPKFDKSAQIWQMLRRPPSFLKCPTEKGQSDISTQIWHHCNPLYRAGQIWFLDPNLTGTQMLRHDDHQIFWFAPWRGLPTLIKSDIFAQIW